MMGEQKQFKFFLVLVISALVFTLFFLFFLKPTRDEFFSEIYFPNPDGLPNKVYPNRSYDFTFSVRNNEGRPETYTYNATIELYSLYDVTEGIYKCAAQHRNKVMLNWKEGGASSEHIRLIKPFEESTNFLYSESDDFGVIDWDHYTISYDFKGGLAGGSFTTTFHDEGTPYYSFTYYDDNSEVVFSYMEDGKLITENALIPVIKGVNKVRIKVDGGLKYMVNDIVIFNVSATLPEQGKIDFRMDDTYTYIEKLKIYQESPIVITKTDEIREYSIDNSIINKRIRALRKGAEEELNLFRNPLTLTLCEEEWCQALQNIVNNPGNDFSYEIPLKKNSEERILSVVEAKGEDYFPTVSFQQNESAPPLDWENYNLRFDFQLFVKPHTLLFKFDDEFKILFHDENIFFIHLTGDSMNVERRTSPLDVGLNQLFVESRNGNLKFKVNNIPMFSLRKDITYQDMEVYTKNTFIAVGRFEISNKGGECSSLDIAEKCKRVFHMETQQPVTTKKARLKAIAQPIVLSVGLGSAPFIGAAQLMDIEGLEDFTGKNDSDGPSLGDLSIAQLLEYDVEIDPFTLDRNLPSETYSFDGGDALLNGVSDYNFRFNFHFLEGSGLLEFAFHNQDGDKLAMILLNPLAYEAYLFTLEEGLPLRRSHFINLTKNARHTFEVNFEDLESIFKLNHRTLFMVEDLDLSTGYFSLSTFHSYFEVREMRLIDRVKDQRIPFSLDRDPCKLKLLKQIPLSQDSLFLDPEEVAEIHQDFAIVDDFDFGSVSVMINQPGYNSSEIHFWVVNYG